MASIFSDARRSRNRSACLIPSAPSSTSVCPHSRSALFSLVLPCLANSSFDNFFAYECQLCERSCCLLCRNIKSFFHSSPSNSYKAQCYLWYRNFKSFIRSSFSNFFKKQCGMPCCIFKSIFRSSYSNFFKRVCCLRSHCVKSFFYGNFSDISKRHCSSHCCISKSFFCW